MLTDRDKIDIFYLTAETTEDIKSDCSRTDLAGGSIAKVVKFFIAHPDMCAVEFDDFILDRKYALQEFDRLVE